MIKKINLKRKDGKIIQGILKKLDESYINKIMKFQDEIVEGLENKELYFPSKEEEFLEFISNKGNIVGCVTEDDDLIAIGVYCKLGYDENNYGYDIGINGEELLKVGQIESTLVKESFRGNKLQKIICELLEDIAKENGTLIMSATASPYNPYSVNTFLDLGYEIAKDKIKYGGLRRYVLVKRFS